MKAFDSRSPVTPLNPSPSAWGRCNPGALSAHAGAIGSVGERQKMNRAHCSLR
jgi:hypothetical protein